MYLQRPFSPALSQRTGSCRARPRGGPPRAVSMVPAPRWRAVPARPGGRSGPRDGSMVACSRPSPGADWPGGRFSRDPRASGLAEAVEGPAFVRRSRQRRALGKMAPVDPRLPSGDGGWRGASPGAAGWPAVTRCGRWGGAGPVASRAECFGGPGAAEGLVGGGREGRGAPAGGDLVGVGPPQPVEAGAPFPSRRVVESDVSGGPGTDRPLRRPRAELPPAAQLPRGQRGFGRSLEGEKPVGNRPLLGRRAAARVGLRGVAVPVAAVVAASPPPSAAPASVT